ncbi:MAG: glutamine synthetase [Bacteroidetes bacterium]|nr:glutamine synthetase [Bacteroidota bacterium]
MRGYALANPLSAILNKTPQDFTRTDLLAIIEQRGIERITFHYVALDGKLKELRIPVASRLQAERILAEGERVDGSSLFKGLVDASLSDLYVVPIYKSAFFSPFDDMSLDFLCRFADPEGNPAPFAIDNILASADRLFRKSTGLELNALGELEFYLLNTAETHMYQTSKQKGYHASAPYIKSGDIVNEITSHLTRITGSVKYAHSEVGYIDNVFSDVEEIRGKQAEQLEIEFLPAPVVDAADYLVLARWLIRNVAFKHGCVATFTPKLEDGVAGSGLHVHMEISKEGQNQMRETSGELSAVARKLIGGLCTYAESLTAFGNTMASSYLRLVPNQEAPTRVCWSDLNRSAMIRVPLGWHGVGHLASSFNPTDDIPPEGSRGRQTVELRSPDGSALIHLLLAGITMAAEWGLKQRDSESAAKKLYVQGNIFKDPSLLKQLPAIAQSCVESSRVLGDHRRFYERENIFPPSMIDYIINLLRTENDEILRESLTDLPADERLTEMRKIMHRDIHRH